MTVDGGAYPLVELCSETSRRGPCDRRISQCSKKPRWPPPTCAYTGLGLPATYGEVGRSYSLHATWDDEDVVYDLTADTYMRCRSWTAFGLVRKRRPTTAWA